MCGVVRGDIDTRVDAVDDQRVGATHTGIHAADETRIAMNSLVGQRPTHHEETESNCAAVDLR
jgi:hypothetical protein